MSDNQTIIKLYNADEVAGFLGVSKVTVYRLVESGVLTCYKIKGSIRISQDDLTKYLEKSRRESDIQ